jgi:RNA ligase (TIGR02306 family)
MGEIVRKLATVERISEIHPIPDADQIERATIRGWNVVVKKGEFKVGDKVIYCEIDSVMPERPEFEFLRPRGFRIKTTKFRGQVSQGIVFPLSILPENWNVEFPLGVLPVSADDALEGDDVTDILGITKYDPPIPACLAGVAKGNFPSHSIKTDEERVQNLVDIYEEYRSKYTWIATEKVDGSSVTYAIFNDEFGVSSRNLELKETEDNTLWKIARKLDIEGKMRKYIAEKGLKGLTLQGEILGEGVQSNKYKLKGQTVKIFRMFDPVSYKFLPYLDTLKDVKAMGLETVPVIEEDMTLPFTVEELIAYADGRSALCDTAREGVVFVAQHVLFPDEKTNLERYQGRLSFKVISNKFILKHDQ